MSRVKRHHFWRQRCNPCLLNSMSISQEVTDLFLQLAVYLKAQNDDSIIGDGGKEEEENVIDFSISNLNQCLNFDEENSGARVLDSVLSLMCFKAPQVFDSMIEYQVKTITSVLQASSGCKVLRFSGQEFLQVGSSICSRDCMDLVRVCGDVLGKLKLCSESLNSGMLSQPLLGAVVKSAVSSSCYQSVYPYKCILDAKSKEGRSNLVSSLICHLPGEFSLKNPDIPLRLLFWYLDPMTLKNDVTRILQETMKRPFLCLGREFRDSTDWHTVVICLALSPVMFTEIRSLLHNWFLLTGRASILQLLIELVSVIIDIVSRPTWWSIPLELGLKLPFSKAYFPYNHHMFQTLTRPLSFESLMTLVQTATGTIFHPRRQSESTIISAEIDIRRINYKSLWALAISFSDWLHFASLILFSGRDFQEKVSKLTIDIPKVDNAEELCANIAARFIAWILSPVSKSHQLFLADCLIKISESWSLMQFGSGSGDKKTVGYIKRLKKPKSDEENLYLRKGHDCIRLLLKELESINISINRSDEGKSSNCLGLNQNALFREVLLGILVGCSNYLDEHGCEVLLHYAATGTILQQGKTGNAVPEIVEMGCDSQQGLPSLRDTINEKDAIAGSSIVFRLTDVAEGMSGSLFDTEEDVLDFIGEIKLRTCKYLVKCTNRLVEIHTSDDGVPMLKDLLNRLVQWKHQGRKLQNLNEIDFVINSLRNKLYNDISRLI